MLKTAPLKASNLRWQYLFPLGQTELYRFPDGSTEKTTFSSKLLTQFVDSFAALDAWMSEQGMATQPRPVTINHGFVNGTTEQEKRRVGNIYAVRLHLEDDGIPRGLWALVEWTNEGLNLIDEGKYNMLSPTNTKIMHLETGGVMKGQFLVEVGLVLEPFLVQIGTAADYVPIDVWPVPNVGRPVDGLETGVVETAPEIQRSYDHIQPAGPVIMRQALTITEMNMSASKNTILVQPRMEPEVETAPESPEVEIDLDDLISKMGNSESFRAMMTPMIERMCNERGYMRREDVEEMVAEMSERMRAESKPMRAEMTEDEMAKRAEMTEVVETEDVVAPRSKPKAADEDARLAEIRVKFRNACWEDADKLIAQGKLLVRDAKAYVNARENGESVDKFTVDQNATAMPQGATAGPPPASPVAPRSVSYREEVAKLLASNPELRRDAVKQEEQVAKMRAKWRADKIEVNP